jgi:hypothetical protein
VAVPLDGHFVSYTRSLLWREEQRTRVRGMTDTSELPANPNPGFERAITGSVWDQRISGFSAGHGGARRSRQHTGRGQQNRRVPTAIAGDGTAAGRR